MEQSVYSKLLTQILSRSVCACVCLILATNQAYAQKQMEQLTRGLVAVRAPSGQVFLSWRLLVTDPENSAFNVYRKTGRNIIRRVNKNPIDSTTNFVDKEAPPDESLSYSITLVIGKDEVETSPPVKVWRNNYLSIPIERIPSYRPGDASVGDLNGDGVLDIVLHQVSRPRDNSLAGITGTPILDAYQLDGTRLWRIDLGQNIREGEHYTQFVVYDLDGDGRAELACKTADGTVDGTGKVIGDAEKDWRTLDERRKRHGRILDGPEYLTIFDGQTGAALETVDYVPNRDPIDGWGGIGGNADNDNYGNRADRFLACVAYLDGKRPSLVMCRGVYGRTVIAAWDWRNSQLGKRWVFDTGSSYPPYQDASPFAGMGGHSLSVADVDNDGKDEIVYQAMVIDDNGQGVYSTGLRHGDAMYVTDMYPDRPGMEVFTVQENETNADRFQTPGVAVRDAETGEILWSHSPTVDVPTGMVADIDPRYPGFEAWGGPGGLRDHQGRSVGVAPKNTNWSLWWDGDPLRELLAVGRPNRRGPRRTSKVSPTSISKWNWHTEEEEFLEGIEGVSYSKWPCLVGDLLGDWREEILLVSPRGDSLRLYTTAIETDRRLVTLLHDPQYRLGLVWQNVGYNTPCYPSFYLGPGMQQPSQPDISVAPSSGAHFGEPQ